MEGGGVNMKKNEVYPWDSFMEGGGVNIRDVVERGKRFCKGVVTVIKNCMYAHIATYATYKCVMWPYIHASTYSL